MQVYVNGLNDSTYSKRNILLYLLMNSEASFFPAYRDESLTPGSLHWYLAIIYQPDAMLEPPASLNLSRSGSVSSRTRSSRAPNTAPDEQSSKPITTNPGE
jgi:hypothetical protein